MSLLTSAALAQRFLLLFLSFPPQVRIVEPAFCPAALVQIGAAGFRGFAASLVKSLTKGF